MRSMKYLPSVSTLSSVKQMVNNSLQKINAIDVNMLIDKYFSGKNDDSSNSNVDDPGQKTRTIDKNLRELSDKSKVNPIQNKPTADEENRLFESALNEWIESKNHLNFNKNPSDDDSVPKTKVSEIASEIDAIPIAAVPSAGVELRTKQLLQSMSRPDSENHTKRRLQELNKLLMTHPEAIGFAVKQDAIQKVLRLNHWSEDAVIRQHSNQALTLLGYVKPPKGTGIKILSLDGGGIQLDYFDSFGIHYSLQF